MKYIIMCGGDYPKFKIPKQLLKVGGEVIIERTIRLLKENGITDIAISTNDERFNYLGVEILHDEDNQFVYWGKDEMKVPNKCWLKAYYPIMQPVCYLHGDVYFSDEAIKTIINTEVKDTMFFCTPDKRDVPNKDKRNLGGREPLAYKVENYKLFRNAIDDLLKMVDEGKFKNAFCGPIAWVAYRYINGLDLVYNAKWFGDWNNIFKSKGDYVIINDYTNDIDDEKDISKIERFIKKGGEDMVKVEVVEDFRLGAFDELKNIVRATSKNAKGMLYVNDVFECDEKMFKYLSGENAKKRAFVQFIEVIPEEKIIGSKDKENIIPLDNDKIKKVAEEFINNIEIKEEKPKKKRTNKKKSI